MPKRGDKCSLRLLKELLGTAFSRAPDILLPLHKFHPLWQIGWIKYIHANRCRPNLMIYHIVGRGGVLDIYPPLCRECEFSPLEVVWMTCYPKVPSTRRIESVSMTTGSLTKGGKTILYPFTCYVEHRTSKTDDSTALNNSVRLPYRKTKDVHGHGHLPGSGGLFWAARRKVSVPRFFPSMKQACFLFV